MIIERNGLRYDTDKDREWRQRSAIKAAERRQAKGRKALPRVSEKRRSEAAIFAVRKKAFLEAHPICQHPTGCHKRAVDVHHRRGTIGSRYLDERWWAASCRPHNDAAETDTGAQRAIGWLLPQFGLIPPEFNVAAVPRVGSPVQTGGPE